MPPLTWHTLISGTRLMRTGRGSTALLRLWVSDIWSHGNRCISTVILFLVYAFVCSPVSSLNLSSKTQIVSEFNETVCLSSIIVYASGKFLLWANELLCPRSVMECLIKIAQLCSSSKCLLSLSFSPSFFTFLSYPSFNLSIFLFSVCGVRVWDVSQSDLVGEEDSCSAGIWA